MVRACAIPLVLWGGLWTLYAYLLSSVLDLTGSFFAGGFVGLMVLAFAGGLIESRSIWRSRRAVSNAIRQAPLVDGRLTAVIGEVVPIDDPAEAPFSGEPCILCEYSIKDPRKSDSSRTESKDPHFGVDVAGFSMTPCQIRSSQGELRLFGFPQLDGFDTIYPALPSHMNAARWLVESDEFDVVGVRIGGLLRSLQQTYVDEDGSVDRRYLLNKEAVTMFRDVDPYLHLPDGFVRELLEQMDKEEDDWDEDEELEDEKGGQDEDEEADQDADEEDDDDGGIDVIALKQRLPKLAETIVPIGAKVCALGIYSAERRGLVPRVGFYSDYTRLYAGDVLELEGRLRREFRQRLFGSSFALIVVHGILGAALILGR